MYCSRACFNQYTFIVFSVIPVLPQLTEDWGSYIALFNNLPIYHSRHVR